MASETPTNIVPEDDEGIADLNDEESTASLRSSILEYPIEHGRRYHAYKSGQYMMPNDEEELDRLDMVSAFMLLINRGKLHRASLDKNQALRILDIGAGTGVWAIEMGDEFPTAEIIGLDISATVPGSVPPNVRFEIQDVEDDWTFTAPFDYIHCRYMAGAIKDWPKLFKQAFDNLKPGGLIEFQDFDIHYYSQDGSVVPEKSPLCRWVACADKSLPITGRTMHPGLGLEKWARGAGFVNLQVEKDPVPIGPWPKEKNLKMIGYLNWTQLMDGMEGMSLRLFCDIMGWSREDLTALLNEAKTDLKNPKFHAMHDVYTVIGQKPE